jgi:hypothetical protein
LLSASRRCNSIRTRTAPAHRQLIVLADLPIRSGAERSFRSALTPESSSCPCHRLCRMDTT